MKKLLSAEDFGADNLGANQDPFETTILKNEDANQDPLETTILKNAHFVEVYPK